MARMLFYFKRHLGSKRKPLEILENKRKAEMRLSWTAVFLQIRNTSPAIFLDSEIVPSFLPRTNRDRIVLLVTFPACCRKNGIQGPWNAACRTRVSFLWSQIHFKQNSDLPGKLTPNCVITAYTWNSRCIHLMPFISSHRGTNGLPETWLLTSISEAYSDLC